jgi:hypothetical protein
MLRRLLLAAALLVPLALNGCGGGPGGSAGGGTATAGGSDPMTVSENQNAPAPQPAEASIPPLILWCSQPGGASCSSASGALGVPPTAGETMPAELFGAARDLPDDCADPDVGRVRDQLTAPMGVSASWVDQGGQLRSASDLRDLYTGGGCTNAAVSGEPSIKIHVIDLAGAPRVIVRVFEIGEY